MYSEPELIRLLFTLADTQQWLSELTTATLSQLPNLGKKKLQKQDYYLSISALTHILERHYHKIPRHPGAGKFCIPLTDILYHIRLAESSTPQPMPGRTGNYRIFESDNIIGHDQHGQHSKHITVITDAKGNILTAFPGKFEPKEKPIEISKALLHQELVGFA